MPADSVETFPMVTVDGLSPVVLVKADAGIGARWDEAAEAAEAAEVADAPEVLGLELLVDEHAVRVAPPTARTARTSVARRRMPSATRDSSERSIGMDFPLVCSALPGTAPPLGRPRGLQLHIHR
jgi:hypothetical protein